ncbi:MAG TPA: TonB-dependent receptor [Gemmatimonadaceae bacterium]|nr:TonB-dependent receptor [Gemmatimonadaceae bacterium]
MRRTVTVAAMLALATRAASSQQSPAGGVSLDSLLNTRISAASKYEQASSAAPGSVTIVTAEDIRTHGYRNLQEVLESVRGFYVSNDRAYPYLGARGFGLPADFNNRILLLVDGHSMNELVWGSAPIGSDLPLNLAAIERVEVVRGPGSALYGTSAMFAVINIVTKTGTAIDGGEIRAGVGSAHERTASGLAGRSLGARGSVAASALITRTDGLDQFYREYDQPETSGGIAHGLDWERGSSALGSLSWDGLRVNAGFRARDKGVPTGVYGTLFGDPRTMTSDRSLWGNVAIHHGWAGAFDASAKVYAARVQYHGVSPYSADPVPYQDFADNVSIGMENMLTWEPGSRERLTIGTEIKRIARARYVERLEDGTESSDDHPFSILSVLAQNELALLPSVSLVTGMRVDHYTTLGSAVTPRIALLLTPDAATTMKLLFGEAFRAPAPAEALLDVGLYVPNPALRPERIRTIELETQRRLGKPLLAGLSIYRYRVSNLIEQVTLDTEEVVYANVSSAVGKGIEAQLDVRPAGMIGGRLSYALQRTTDAHGVTLTNSPLHVGILDVERRGSDGVFGAVQLRYESGRRTISGPSTSAFARVDGNLGYSPVDTHVPRWIGGTSISLRVTNLFDVAYASPAGLGNVQSAIAADGRVFALRVDWRR